MSPREERIRELEQRMRASGLQGKGGTREQSEDRVGWPCACGCMQVVPPFEGKGRHPRCYASSACGNRERQRRHKRKRKEAT